MAVASEGDDLGGRVGRRHRAGLVLAVVQRARRARRRARQGADAQERLSRQAGAGGQPERAAQAEAAGRGVRDPAGEAAAGQGRDGRAAVRHQPGRARPWPAVRAVPPGPGGRQGLLRRAADLDQGRWPLSRHRLVRGRHRESVAHRHPAQLEHHDAEGQRRRARRWRRRRAPIATSMRPKSRKSAVSQRSQGQGAWRKPREASHDARTGVSFSRPRC